MVGKYNETQLKLPNVTFHKKVSTNNSLFHNSLYKETDFEIARKYPSRSLEFRNILYTLYNWNCYMEKQLE